jgi:hypothetical protein
MRTSIIVVTVAALFTAACERKTATAKRPPATPTLLQQAREEAFHANERAQEAERSAADNARQAAALQEELDRQRGQLAEAEDKAAQAAQAAQNARAEADAARQQANLPQPSPERVIQYEARPSPNPTRSRVPANVQPSDVIPGDTSAVPVNIDPDDDTARRNVDQSNGPVTPPVTP